MDESEYLHHRAPSKKLDPLTLALLIVAVVCVVGYLAYDHVLRKKTEAVETATEKATDVIAKAGKTATDVVKEIAAEANREIGAGERETTKDAPQDTAKNAPEDAPNDDGLVGGLIGKIKETAKGIDSKDVVRRGAEIGHDITRAGADLADQFVGFSLDEEWQWGERLRAELLHQLTISTDEQATDRIRKLAEPLLSQLTRTKGRPYEFFIVEEPIVNAFSALGGNVFVYQGLIDEMPSDTALQGAIAHEIGHVDLGHCVKGSAPALRAQEQAGGLGGAIVGQLHKFLQLGYSEEQEFEADLFAYKAMRGIGASKADRILFAKVLHEYAVKNDIHDDLDTKAETLGGQLSKEVRKHYRSHPPSPERLHKLEQLPE